MLTLRQNSRITGTGGALALLLLLALSELSISSAEGSQGGSQIERIRQTWGIEPLALRLTAGGYMLDFRYRVLDSEKAAPLFERRVKPVLIDKRSGAQFMVPVLGKVGPLRPSNPPQGNRNYFVLFANPGKFVKPGSEVSIVIGDFKVEHLKVE